MEVVYVSSDEKRRVRTETLWLSPVRKAVLTKGGLVTRWPIAPTAVSTYCEIVFPCSVTRSPLLTPGIHDVPPSK